VVAEPGDDGALHQHPGESKGRPGSRAPHLFVERSGARVSTLDLFGSNFVLLLAPGGEAWRGAAMAAAQEVGVPIDCHVISDPQFADAYGVSAAGAVLVRPDGVVGWRAVDADGASVQTMQHALASLLCRTDQTGG
jgi:hypothetical protein